jgi:predicted nuclease with TOPRIM domain
MNQEAAIVDETVYDALEEKVNRAVDLIRRLKDEKSRLLAGQAELEAKLAESAAVPAEVVQNLESRLAEMERERTQWLGEKKDLTRRIEGILAKLELLESESVSH